jgi:arylsulfatase A-like enzyme
VTPPADFLPRQGRTPDRERIHSGTAMNCTLLLSVATVTALAAGAAGGEPEPAAAPKRPNIIVVLADDIGYGDLGCYGATKVKTPNVDRLAAQGLRFTDGHSASATCTPTRYALITGEYPWRRKGTGILTGVAGLIVEPGRTTLPSMLQKAGYATASVGKWHLGLGTGPTDYNGEIKPGPLDVGFDTCFLIPATGDRVPCVYVEDRRVVGLDPADPIRVSYGAKIGDEPTGKDQPEMLVVKNSHGHDNTIVNGVGRIGFMAGGRAARWKDEDMADTITRKAVAFIEKNRDRPFFLYFATHDIHVPRVPHPRYKSSSLCGVRGDVIQQFDGCVGELTAALDRLGIAENTLVVVTSDNGPVVDDGYADGAVKDLNGHAPAGPLRGGKYSIYEGGTRMPFLVRWPARVKPGISDALVCQVDFLASFAALVGQALPDDAGPDSINVLPALLGESKRGRETLVEHSAGTALREGTWKFVPKEKKGAKAKAGDAAEDEGGGELYNLAEDLGEEKNVAARHPDRVKAMAERLRTIRDAGRSRP